MTNTAQLLDNGILFVKKVGDQTGPSMIELYTKVLQLAAELRKAGKPVLVLADASEEGYMDHHAREVAVDIGKSLDFDKSATFGADLVLKTTRELMIKATDLNAKVRNFATRAEAEKWLLS